MQHVVDLGKVPKEAKAQGSYRVVASATLHEPAVRLQLLGMPVWSLMAVKSSAIYLVGPRAMLVALS